MHKKSETGRTMTETIAVLAIIGILSVAGIWYYAVSLRQHAVDEVLNTLSMKTVAIHSELVRKQLTNTDEINELLAQHTTQIRDYELAFHAAPGGDGGFVSEITRRDGKPIRGAICKDLIKKMAAQQFVSDVDFTLQNEELDDGTTGDVNVRLNGKVLHLSAVCGS